MKLKNELLGKSFVLFHMDQDFVITLLSKSPFLLNWNQSLLDTDGLGVMKDCTIFFLIIFLCYV